MSDVKIVFNDGKKGRSYQKVFPNNLIGKKIGDLVEGSLFGLKGFKLKITGGTDNAGFPMRIGMDTGARKKVLISKGAGIRKCKKGEKLRKSVRGSIIGEQIAQVNIKVVEYGKGDLGELLGIKVKEETKEVEEKVEEEE